MSAELCNYCDKDVTNANHLCVCEDCSTRLERMRERVKLAVNLLSSADAGRRRARTPAPRAARPGRASA
jgi:hypothetical protein